MGGQVDRGACLRKDLGGGKFDLALADDDEVVGAQVAQPSDAVVGAKVAVEVQDLVTRGQALNLIVIDENGVCHDVDNRRLVRFDFDFARQHRRFDGQAVGGEGGPGADSGGVGGLGDAQRHGDAHGLSVVSDGGGTAVRMRHAIGVGGAAHRHCTTGVQRDVSDGRCHRVEGEVQRDGRRDADRSLRGGGVGRFGGRVGAAGARVLLIGRETGLRLALLIDLVVVFRRRWGGVFFLGAGRTRLRVGARAGRALRQGSHATRRRDVAHQGNAHRFVCNREPERRTDRGVRPFGFAFGVGVDVALVFRFDRQCAGHAQRTTSADFSRGVVEHQRDRDHRRDGRAPRRSALGRGVGIVLRGRRQLDVVRPGDTGPDA